MRQLIFALALGLPFSTAAAPRAPEPASTPAQAQAQPRVTPGSLVLLGKRFCFGQPEGVTCDVRLPAVLARLTAPLRTQSETSADAVKPAAPASSTTSARR